MEAIIDGKRYSTETAEEIVECGSHPSVSSTDFHYEVTHLYRTPKGAFFLAGRGGPRSRWAQRVDNGSTGGKGIEPITADVAKAIVEKHCDVATYTRLFGQPEDA